MHLETLPTQHQKNTSNPFRDVIDNLVEILIREQKEDPEQKLKYISRITEVIDEDRILIPRTPCLAVTFTDWVENVRTIGQRRPVAMDVEVGVNVFYYHQELNDKIRKNEVRDALWEISRLLRRNSDLNGLSTKGATIQQGELINRMRSNKYYTGGMIRMTVPVLFQERRGITPDRSNR